MIQDRIREFRRVSAAELLPDPRNWRRHPKAQRAALQAVLEKIGFADAVLARENDAGELVLIDGHLRADMVKRQDIPTLVLDVNEDEAAALLASIDPLAAMAETDSEAWSALLEGMQADMRALAEATGPGHKVARLDSAAGALQERFVIPPFSVLDARQGYWRERKNIWLALGLVSEAGRDDRLIFHEARGGSVSQRISGTAHGTSIFDPVLAELAYRWFTAPGARVLDPFAGGSVRGVVAAKLGRFYTGVDLRPEQVEENRRQWASLSEVPMAVEATVPDNTPELTPVERIGEVWVKRDDAFAWAGCRGGKVRTCRVLADGARGLVTAGSRQSPQANIVAQMARRMGVPCRVHTPQGELSPELLAAQAAGAEIVQHPAGYNTVIVARARDDAAARGWTEIPFGMECEEAVEQTARQVANIPGDVRRLLVPCGSGMSLAGILTGLERVGRTDLPVTAVVVGADPEKRLDRYAPKEWRSRVTLVPSGLDYHAHAPATRLGTIELDPVYEAKLLPFVEPGDCVWIVGRRQTAEPLSVGRSIDPGWITGDSREVVPTLDGPFDFIFSCPPYGDLETYSDDPADLSNMKHEEFLGAYREVIKASVEKLADDRFACFVVGDFRDAAGVYRNFPGDTVTAFLDAGMRLYNEAVLATNVGSASLRAGGQFVKSRKLAKCHQNVLVFVKGDPKRATEWCGDIEVELPEADPDA